MRGTSNGFITLLALIVVFGGFAFLLYQNTQLGSGLVAVVPTQIPPTRQENPLGQIFSEGFGSDATGLPTVAIPTQPFVAPTLPPPLDTTPTLLSAADLVDNSLFTLEPVSTGVRPTALPATPTAVPTGVAVAAAGNQPTQPWQPPALIPPLNRDPLGRDHYYFSRPLDPNFTNFGLAYYAYGMDGPQSENPSLVHHGIDMPNAIGTPVRAAGPGTIIFVPTPDNPYFQNSPGYGNVVVIEHDFGWQGNNRLWTLYGHVQSALVAIGEHVEAGDAIALSGNSGRSSGPHMHFEVRMGVNPSLRYGDTYNPVLWMVPYVGHGTVAGLYTNERGEPLDDRVITLRNQSSGIFFSTTTYIYLGTVNDVSADPNWGENFAIGDVPVGRYEAVADFEGQRITRIIDVVEGRTTFVTLEPRDPATAQPIPTES